MNVVLLLIYIGCSLVIIFEQPNDLIPSIMAGCENTIKFLPILFASYCVWLPATKMLEKSGISKKSQKLLLPVNKFLFPNEKEKTYEYLSINLSGNLLGIGGASTPSGLNAMENITSKKNKTMLVVINSLSIQLVPTTVIAMRSSKGAIIDIVLPSLIATIITTSIGIILVKLLVKK